MFWRRSAPISLASGGLPHIGLSQFDVTVTLVEFTRLRAFRFARGHEHEQQLID